MVDLISITISNITNASFTSQVLALVSVFNIHSVYNTTLDNNAEWNLGNINYFVHFSVQLLLITHLILLRLACLALCTRNSVTWKQRNKLE